MKRALLLALLTVLAAVLNLDSRSFGRPPYKKQWDATYKNPQLVAAAKEAKCSVCHYGTDKKNRNDYGKALSKHLNEKLYNQLKGDPKALDRKIQEAFKAVAKEKSASGKTFGELLEAGRLPGTPPRGSQ